MNRKHAVVASVVTLSSLAGIAAWSLLDRDNHPRAHASHAPSGGGAASLTSMPSAPSAPVRPGWSVGREYVYKTSLSVSATLGDKQVVGLDLAGKLSLCAVDVDEQFVLVRGQLGELSIHLGDGAPAQQKDLESNLGMAFYFTAGADARVTLVRLPEGLSLAAEGILKALPSLLQFSFPQWPPPQSWSSEEIDPTGRYVAEYASASPGLFVKHKSHYVEVLGATNTGIRVRVGKPEITSSSAAYRFAGGALKELSLQEEIQVPADVLPTMSSRTALSLVLTAEQDAAGRLAKWREAADGLRDETPYDVATSKHRRRPEIEQERIAGRDFRGMLTSVASARLSEGGKEKQETERHRAFVGLSALLRTSGQATREALQYVRVGGPEKRLVIDALGSAGSPEAQAALVSLLRDQQLREGEDRERAVRALALTKEPTAPSVAFVAKLTDDSQLGGQAKMALGTLVHNVESTDPAAAKLGTDRLLAKLGEDDGTRAMNTDLRALGNAGSVDALARISALLNYDNPEIRASAVQGLRRIPGQVADNLIALTLLNDPDRGVRNSAANAMRDRLPSQTLVDAASSSVRLDTDVNTRLEVLRTLGVWPGALPIVLDAIRWVALNDASDKLRSIAESYLSEIATG